MQLYTMPNASNNEIKWQGFFNIKLNWGNKKKKIQKETNKKIQESVIKQQPTTFDNLFFPHSWKRKENKAKLSTTDLGSIVKITETIITSETTLEYKQNLCFKTVI